MNNKYDTWEGRRALTDNATNNSGPLAEAARQLMGLDQLSEAVTLGILAGDDAFLKEIISLASAEGNFFIFNAAFIRLKDQSLDRSLVKTLKEAAEKSGKGLYAEQATAWLEANQ